MSMLQLLDGVDAAMLLPNYDQTPDFSLPNSYKHVVNFLRFASR